MPVDMKLVDASIREMLLRHGFTRRRYGIFTRDQSADVLAWVGLNRSTGRGYLGINMVVGLRFARVEALVSQLLGISDDGITPATVAGNVGYVAGRAEALLVWFSSDEHIGPGVKELEAALQDYAYPYFAENCTLQRLRDILVNARYLISHQVPYRLPVVLSMLGQHLEAVGYVHSKCGEEAGRTDPAADRYRAFATAFLARVTRGEI